MPRYYFDRQHNLASYQSCEQRKADVFEMESGLITQAMQQGTREEAAAQLEFLLELGLLHLVDQDRLRSRIDSVRIPFSGPNPMMTISSSFVDSLLLLIVPNSAYRAGGIVARMSEDNSEIVIGVDYGLGDKGEVDIRRDWNMLESDEMDLIINSTGSVVRDQSVALPQLLGISINYGYAKNVFINTRLIPLGSEMSRAYPGVEHLDAGAQSAVMSLVWSGQARGATSHVDGYDDALRDSIRRGDVASLIGVFERIRMDLRQRGDTGAVRLREMEIGFLRRSMESSVRSDVILVE